MKNIISSITIFYPFLKRIFMKKLKFKIIFKFLFIFLLYIDKYKKYMKYDKKKKDHSDIIFFIF